MATAQLLVRVNGGAPQSGGVAVPASATIAFQFADTNGWKKYKLTIIGPPSWPCPAGWTDEAGAYTFTGVATPPPALTLPLITLWGKFMIELLVNDGLENGVSDRKLRDRATALSMLSAAGTEDFGVGEEGQFGGSTRAWVAALQKLARKVDSGGGPKITPFDANHVYAWTFDDPVGTTQFVDVGSAGAGLVLSQGVAANPVRAGAVSPVGNCIQTDCNEGESQAGTLTCSTSMPALPTTNYTIEFFASNRGINAQTWYIGLGTNSTVFSVHIRRGGSFGPSATVRHASDVSTSERKVTYTEWNHIMLVHTTAFVNKAGATSNRIAMYVNGELSSSAVVSGSRNAFTTLWVFRDTTISSSFFEVQMARFALSDIARPPSYARNAYQRFIGAAA